VKAIEEKMLSANVPGGLQKLHFVIR